MRLALGFVYCRWSVADCTPLQPGYAFFETDFEGAAVGELVRAARFELLPERALFIERYVGGRNGALQVQLP